MTDRHIRPSPTPPADVPRRPLIVLIDDDEQACADVERVLRSRYDVDYDVVRIDSSTEAVARITAAHDDGHEIALVLAGHWLTDDTVGTDLLGRIGAIVPDTRRALLIDWGDTTTYELDPEAMAKDYPALLDAGCNIVGGCCGSGPEHIRRIAAVARSRARR